MPAPCARLPETARLWLAFTQLALGELEPALLNMEKLEAACSIPNTCSPTRKPPPGALASLSKAVAALGDSSARAHQLLAYRYKARGEWRIAVKELRRAAELRPRLAGVRLDAAEILWEQQQFDEAGEELQAELRVHASGFLANLRYGQLLLRRPWLCSAVSRRSEPLRGSDALAFGDRQKLVGLD